MIECSQLHLPSCVDLETSESPFNRSPEAQDYRLYLLLPGTYLVVCLGYQVNNNSTYLALWTKHSIASGSGSMPASMYALSGLHSCIHEEQGLNFLA